MTRSLQRKITQVEEDLAQLDTSIAELEEKMSAPELLEDHVGLMNLNQELETARQKQEELLGDWENLSLELEEMETNG